MATQRGRGRWQTTRRSLLEQKIGTNQKTVANFLFPKIVPKQSPDNCQLHQEQAYRHSHLYSSYVVISLQLDSDMVGGLDFNQLSLLLRESKRNNE